MKILNTIGEKFTQEARRLLEQVAEVDYAVPTQGELKKIIGRYDAVFAGLGLIFDIEVILAAKKLKCIATATTGLDHVDTKALGEAGIEIISLRGEDKFLNTITGTSELAFALLLDLARFSPWAFEDVKNYKWERENFRGHSLYSKTLGIVGLGRLGSIMASQAVGFGMKVVFCDPNKEAPIESGYQKVPLGQLLRESDAVSIHIHLNPGTENMFGNEQFSAMRKSAYLINTSRGKIVDEGAVLKALQNGEIAGYAADVLSDELSFERDGFSNNPLVEYAKQNRNCIIVPHLGGMTHESRAATDIFIAKKLSQYLKTI